MSHKNMTDKQILKKSIEKAVKNGWGKGVDLRRLDWTIAHDINFMSYNYYYSIIFSRDFSNAFFQFTTEGLDGKSIKITHVIKHPGQSGIPYVDYHLQQMVIKKEPLKYLEKFLN